MLSPGFVVFALPRSRTAWLARFLTYDQWSAGHDELRHCRSLDDVRSWLAQPYPGTVETAAAPWWRLLRRLAPDTRVAIVRRDPAAVFASLRRMPYEMDWAYIVRELQRQDAALDELTDRWPQALSVAYADLAHEDACARLFEHCLRYRHDHDWWASLAQQNLQADVDGVVRDVAANTALVERLKRDWRPYVIRLEDVEGVTFAHCDVEQWSPRIARQIRADFDSIMRLHGGPIYGTTNAPHDGDWDKWVKFLVLMGLTFHTTVPGSGKVVYARWR
jgi:hypothetical protein